MYIYHIQIICPFLEKEAVKVTHHNSPQRCLQIASFVQPAVQNPKDSLSDIKNDKESNKSWLLGSCKLQIFDILASKNEWKNESLF